MDFGVARHYIGEITEQSAMLDRKDKTAPVKGQTDWERLGRMTEADIQRGIDNDPDAAPDLSYEETKAQYRPHPPRIVR